MKIFTGGGARIFSTSISTNLKLNANLSIAI